MPEMETKKRVPSFWLNLGIMCSALAVVVLVVVGSLVVKHLKVVHQQTAAELSETQKNLLSLQETVTQLKQGVTEQKTAFEALKEDAKTTQVIDPKLNELYVKLTTLISRVNQLTLLTIKPEAKPMGLLSENQAQEPWWKRFFHSMGVALSRIVVVRKLPDASPPFIFPDQKIYFYQNLIVEIENAKWALLHNQPSIYQASIQQVIGWVTQYADPVNATTQEVLQTLDQLKGAMT